MTYQQLDHIFPFIIFGYGLIMTVVLNSELFLKLAEERLPRSVYLNFLSHRFLGLICLILGSLWSLQNLWFYS
jgi:hypothetical protein